eukprot:7975989-Pyramimonas_sp.AAC.1
MPGAESLSAEHAGQYALHGQSEDASDLQAEGDCSHSIENNEEHARFHISPCPSRHLDPLPDRRVGLAPDRATIKASQKAILGLDDDLDDGESPNQGGCSADVELPRRNVRSEKYARN